MSQKESQRNKVAKINETFHSGSNFYNTNSASNCASFSNPPSFSFFNENDKGKEEKTNCNQHQQQSAFQFVLDSNLVSSSQNHPNPFQVEGNNNAEVSETEQLFSIQDVKKIVEEREQQIINEFTQVLQERLEQQHLTFVQFTEDFLSRQMKSSKHSYMS